MESTSETNQLLLPSSSSSLPRRHYYDVFLSFRGEDTRKSFTDHLYAALCRAGVHTFRDAEELRKGEDISTDLIKAIQESKISIIVFSKTYASSRWCLEEVVKIVECKENANQVVFPVFYDVNPSEVRKQTGGFADAFSQHQQRFKPQKISQWKTALTKVANFSGWDLQNDVDWYESKFIDKIVENVLQVVNRTYLNVAKYPVGIHARIRNILSFLQSEANDDVRMIGIYGLGGAGKTTLANAVFNQIYRTFDGSCFLGDVGKEYANEGDVGLKRLQEQLLCKILRKSFKVDHVAEGISLIKERLGLKKVLIVVDDVDLESQLDALVGDRNWFGSGSAIIVTTRNVNLLNGLGKDCEKYNVAMLSDEESLQLFSWHAFKNPNPLKPFIELSNMIVSYAGGLPLALTVLGSHFRARSSVHEWSNDFEKLRRIPHNDILKILKISYDALDDDTQRIFLDIACFFIGGFYEEYIVMVLNHSNFYAQSGIRTLIDKCLLAEDLSMHDLVRDMGREVVRKEAPTQPEKRSRLTLADDVFDVLKGDKGTEAIETMIVYLQKNVNLNTKVFSKMTRLRLLKILSMNARGSLKYLSNELRLLYWKNCPLRCISSDLCLGKLVILEIQGDNIEEFQPNLQHFTCLEVLVLALCKNLKRAPNFGGAHSLKKLSLWGCSKLVELPQSIEDLKNLVQLDLGACKNLRALPSSICELKSLKDLNLRGCTKIKELPAKLGKLEQLGLLNAIDTSVSHLPFSCGSLRYLKTLLLPPFLEGYRSVKPIGHLTSSYANLCSLETLRAPYQSLQHLSLLANLDLQTGCGNLSLLKDLDLRYSCFHSLPLNLCHLAQLQVLRLDNCLNLQVIKDLPPCLENLFAVNCPLLESVRDLPPSLKDLLLDDCPLLEDIQDLSGLLGLHYLYFYNCSNLVELRGLENLVELREIDLRNCSTLSSKSWFVNLFKALLQNPNCREWLKMSVSKDMVSKYLCSNNEVAGCSSNYSLPLFLKKKGIFIVVEILCLFRLQFLDYKMIGTELIYPDDDMEVRCTVYNLFTEPNKFQEVEELIELHSSSEQRWKKRSILQTCIVYEEEGEVYFIPMNPNVVIKFHPESTDNEITGMEREQQNEGSCIWDALCLHPLFRCLGFSD